MRREARDGRTAGKQSIQGPSLGTFPDKIEIVGPARLEEAGPRLQQFVGPRAEEASLYMERQAGYDSGGCRLRGGRDKPLHGSGGSVI